MKHLTKAQRYVIFLLFYQAKKITFRFSLFIFHLIRACPCFAGSPPYGLRFARCFARFAPPGGSRKNLATKAKKTKKNPQKNPLLSKEGQGWLCFSLFVFHFPLSTFHFSLFVFRFSLFTFHFPLFTFHFSLFTFRFSLFVFHLPQQAEVALKQLDVIVHKFDFDEVDIGIGPH